MAGHNAAGALVFDLGGVIVAHDNAFLSRQLASRCSDPAHAETVMEGQFDPRYGTGEWPMSRFHDHIAREFGYAANWLTFCADWNCHFTLDPQMLTLVEKLATQNRVMLFSNTNQLHWDYLVGISNGRLGRLEAYLSHEIRDAKPAVTAFRRVAELANIEPAQSIFIDDVAQNVEGARQAGFLAHQFRNQPALERFLRDAGATWII